MSNIDSITLAQFINLNDRVMVHVSDESRSYATYPPNGQQGTVVGFNQHEYVHDRLSKRKTGVYSKRGNPLVRFDDRTGRFFGASDLAFVDPTLKEARMEARRARGGYETDDEYSSDTWLRELPETAIWEGDTVNVLASTRKAFGAPYEDSATAAVLKVTYIDYGKENDANDPTRFNVQGMYSNGCSTGSTYVQAKDLVLVEHGNLWRYHHNMPLVFSDLMDEVKFANVMHKVEEVRNPVTKSYAWTLKEAVAAIHAGIADAIGVSQGLFGSGPTTRVSRFEDRDLGERVRAKTLAGFSEVLTEEEENSALFEPRSSTSAPAVTGAPLDTAGTADSPEDI